MPAQYAPRFPAASVCWGSFVSSDSLVAHPSLCHAASLQQTSPQFQQKFPRTQPFPHELSQGHIHSGCTCVRRRTLFLRLTACSSSPGTNDGKPASATGNTSKPKAAETKKIEKPKPTGNAQLDAINDNLWTAQEHFARSKELIVQAIQAKDDAQTLAKEEAAAAADKASGMTETEKTELFKKTLENPDSLKLSAFGKTIFQDGAKEYGNGLQKMVPELAAVRTLVTSTKASLESANLLEKAKLTKIITPATALASSLPENVAAALTTGGRMVQFGLKNNVDVSDLQSAINKANKEAASQ